MKQESNAKVRLAFFPRSYLLKGPGGSSTQSPWWGLLLVSCPCGRAGCVGRRCRDRGDCNLWTMDAWLSLRGLHSGLLSRAPFSGPALSQADPHTRRSSRAFLPFQRPPWGSGQDRHADCHHLGGSPLPCCDPSSPSPADAYRLLHGFGPHSRLPPLNSQSADCEATQSALCALSSDRPVFLPPFSCPQLSAHESLGGEGG